MKKIIGSVAAIAAIWAGSTAYIGSQTKDYLEKQIAQSNKLYGNSGFKLSLDTFEKGFLTSKAIMKLDIAPDSPLKAQMQEMIKLPFTTTYDIENGPIFFQHGFGFGMIKIVNEINFAEVFNPELQVQTFLGDNNLTFTSHTNVGFNSVADYHGSSNPLNLTLPTGEKLAISPIVLEGAMNVDTLQGKATLGLKSITLAKDASLKEKIDVKDMKMDINIKKFFDNGFYLADIAFNIGKLNFDVPNEALKLKDASAGIDIVIDQNKDKTIKMSIDLNLDVSKSTLPTDIPAVKNVALGYNLDGADFDGIMAFQDFIQEMQEKQQALMTDLTKAKNMEEQMAVIVKLQEFQKYIMDNFITKGAALLVKDKTHLSYYMSTTDKTDKKSLVDTKIKYLGDPLKGTVQEIQAQLMKNLLTSLAVDIDVNIEESLLKTLPKDVAEDIAMKLEMSVAEGIVKKDKGAYSLNANYTPKTIMVNDKNMTSTLLPFIEMGLGGL